MEAHTFNPSTQEVDLYKCESNLVYRVSSSTVKATQRNPVSKTKQKRKERERGLALSLNPDFLTCMWPESPLSAGPSSRLLPMVCLSAHLSFLPVLFVGCTCSFMCIGGLHMHVHTNVETTGSHQAVTTLVFKTRSLIEPRALVWLDWGTSCHISLSQRGCLSAPASWVLGDP